MLIEMMILKWLEMALSTLFLLILDLGKGKWIESRER